MSDAGVILIINLLVAALLCGMFLVIAIHDSRYVSARWFAAAYCFGMVYIGFEALLPLVSDPRVTPFLGLSAFLCALLLINIGLARLYESEPPWTLLAGIFGVSLVTIAVSMGFARGTMPRMFLYQAPFFAMQAVGAWIVYRHARRHILDTLLAVFLALSAVHYLAKPFAAIALGGPGDTPQDYLSTTYAFVSQSAGTVFVVATALLLLTILVRDILYSITRTSETDLLSGLLNRRGFESRLETLISKREVNGLPLSLITCDLDRFKSVNDTYGHVAGDRLIEAFAHVLRQTAHAHHVVGRIGGEEFAISLPGSNLGAARLFAENVRSVVAGVALQGLPPGRRFTASFGVAELIPGEPMRSLLARSDAALYEAKRAGRDCVRIWQPDVRTNVTELRARS